MLSFGQNFRRYFDLRAIDMRTMGLVAVILIAAGLRLVPHAPNFSPIAAMALFGGAYLSRKSLAFLAPLAAMFLSDLVIGLHDSMFAVYASIAIVVLLGFALSPKRSMGRIGLATVSGSLVFFVLTNFAVWMSSGMYSHTVQGLVDCYVAALPFLQNSLAGDALYAVVLFGGWALVEKAVPSLVKA